MANPRPLLFLAAPLTLAFLAAVPAGAAGKFHMESETLFRWFQQEQADGDKKTGAPAYEYLRLDYGALDGDGLSAHLYGWGRYDLGSYYDDNTAGEVLYGYAQYAQAKNNLLVRLGRQYLFQSGSSDSLDGALVAGDVTPFFSLSGYAGQPVALEETNGRSGDLLWGGRVAHHWKGLYELGVSYKREDNDGDKNAETLGLDVSVTPPWPVSFYGYSKRNLVTDGWAEHSYEARLTVAEFLLRPYYQRFQTGDTLDDGVGTPKPFKDMLFFNGDETVSILGGDASWRFSKGFEVGAKAKHYDYDTANATSWYYAGTVTQRWGATTEVGGEVGRMQGDRDTDRYTSVGAHGYVDKVPYGGKVPLFLSADLVYAHYDKDIYGKSQSLFASLGGGMRFLSDTMQIKLSGDYSADPYFDSDFRVLAAFDYTFDK